MAQTLVTLRNRIGERLQDTSFRSISVATVNDIINQSLKYYKFRRFWFNDKEQDITLNVNDPIMPNIPTDLLQELPEGALTIKYSNIFYPVMKRSSQVYDAMNVQAVGLPFMYTYRAQQYELYFYPNIAYLLKFRYLKDYADLVSDADTNDFLSFSDMMIYYNALSRIYGEYKQDEKMEAYYTARAADEETNVSRRTSALSGTGILTLDSHLLS